MDCAPLGVGDEFTVRRFAAIGVLRTSCHLGKGGWNYRALDEFLLHAKCRQDLVELELFAQAKKVLDALRGCSCTAALAWASENRARLKKAKSKLEFELRLQEFVELARKNSLPEALAYARKYFPTFAETSTRAMILHLC